MKINESTEMNIEDFFDEVQKGGKFEILSPEGWVSIGDLYMKHEKDCFTVKTPSFKIDCSYDHMLFTENGWKKTDDILVGSNISTKKGFEPVISKENIGISDVYDLEILSDEHAYFSNDIVSHNTSKTSCIRSFENIPVEWRGKQYPGYKVVYVPLANYEEMGDLLGLPSRHICMEYKGEDSHKIEEWVPEQCVEGYKNIGWKFLPQRGVKTFCAPPAWVPQEPGPTILLFDDWNRASLRIIKGVMQLLQTYGTVTWKLPPGSHIVLTGNPDDQDYQVTSLDKAIITRLRSCTMKFDVREWSVWAQQNDLDSRGITWGLQNFESMIGKEQTNPRTLAEVFRTTKGIGDLNERKNEIEFRRIAASLLDEDTVNAMMIYMQRDVGLVAEPEKILSGESINGKTVEKYIDGLMSTKNGQERRTDIIGVLCDRLFAWIHQDSVVPTPVSVKNFQSFITLDPIPEDIRFSFVSRVCKCKENGRLSKWILGNKKLDGILKTIFQAD